MKPKFEDLLNELKNKKVRLSHQRVKVLEFLALNQCHPTVEQIFNNLHREIPTLSKTTVYNTLNSLINIDIVKVLNIEDNELRYDIKTNNHGHFKCECCKEIFDFYIDIDSFEFNDLKDFKINDKNIYFKGICRNCMQNNINK